jgi:hypothetical protein
VARRHLCPRTAITRVERPTEENVCCCSLPTTVGLPVANAKTHLTTARSSPSPGQWQLHGHRTTNLRAARHPLLAHEHPIRSTQGESGPEPEPEHDGANSITPSHASSPDPPSSSHPFAAHPARGGAGDDRTVAPPGADDSGQTTPGEQRRRETKKDGVAVGNGGSRNAPSFDAVRRPAPLGVTLAGAPGEGVHS